MNRLQGLATTVEPERIEMRTVEHRGESIECYQDEDLQSEAFVAICEQAQRLWERRVEEYVAEHGRKVGTSVIGAGFTVWYVPPRGRSPRRKLILRAPRKFQNCITWESSKTEIAAFFADNKVNVHYEWGAMD